MSPDDDPAPSLAPLGCSSCGRPIALGEGDTVTCTFCGSDVQIPPAYVDLRAAARLDDVARSQAEAIALELARPTSRGVRFWILAGDVAVTLSVLVVFVWIAVSLVLCIGSFVDAGLAGAAIMLLVGLVLGVPLLWDEALHGLAQPLGTDFADVLGGAGSYGLLGLGIFAATVVSPVVSSYASAFESVRSALRDALAAVPAASPEAASTCRSCGAPLHVVGQDVHARCVYCRADNLVLLPGTARATFEHEVKASCEDLQSAIEAETAAARQGRRAAARYLVQSFAIVPVCILLGRCVAALNENDATFWQPASATAPMIPRTPDNPVLPRGQPTVFDVTRTFDGCDESVCWAYYFVALREGETPWLSAEGSELRLTEVARLHVGPWYDPTYVWRSATLDAGAPYDGWFRVKLVTPKARSVMPTVDWGTHAPGYDGAPR